MPLKKYHNKKAKIKFGNYCLRSVPYTIVITTILSSLTYHNIYAAEQDHNADGGGDLQLTANNSATWSGTAAGLDEIFHVDNGDNVGDTGVVVSATTLDGIGTLRFDGSSTATGTIGDTNNRLGLLSVGVNGSTVTFAGAGAIFATNIHYTGTGTASFSGNITVTDDIDFKGNAGTLSLSDNVNITGAIDNDGSTGGTITFLGTSTVSGTIGNTNAVGVITGGATGEIVTLSSAVNASDINFSGTGTISLGGTTTITNDIDFAGNAGTLSIADNANIAGAGVIDNTTGTGGDITFLGTSTVSGTVGSTNRVGTITGGANGETVTFSDNVTATSISFSGTGGISLADDTTITNNVDFNNNAGTLTLADNVTLTSVVDNTGGTGGNITFSGTGEITGNIGATNAIGTLTAGAASSTVTLSGNFLQIADINFSNTGTVNINNDITVTNDINFAGNAGTLNLAAGVDVTGAIDNTVSTGGNITFAGNGSISGATGGSNAVGTITLNGSNTTVTTGNIAATTYALAGNTLSASGTVTTINGSTISSTISSSSSFGSITAPGNATIDANTTLNLTIDSNIGYVANGTTFKMVDANDAGSGVADLSTTITDDSTMLSFSQVTSNNADLVIQANRVNTYDKVATNTNSSKVGAALESAGPAASGDMANILNTLDNMSSTSQIANAVKEMTPETSGGTIESTINTQVQSLNVIENRLANIRGSNIPSSYGSTTNKGNYNPNLRYYNPNNTYYRQNFNNYNQNMDRNYNYYGNSSQGISGGASQKRGAVWSKGFYNKVEQDKRTNNDGYSAETYGATFGMDTFLYGKKMIVGAAYSYAVTEVDPKGVNTIDGTDITSHQVAVYGNINNRRKYVEGLLSFALNQYDSTRGISFASINRKATADYNGYQLATKFGGGYNFYHNGFIITPNVSLLYSKIKIFGYSEEGAADLNLSFEDQDYEVLQSSIGAKISREFVGQSFSVIPEARTALLYDFIGEKQQSTATFTGGGSAFTVTTDTPEQLSISSGLGLTLETAYDISLIAGYDYEYKEDFAGHSGSLKMKYEF